VDVSADVVAPVNRTFLTGLGISTAVPLIRISRAASKVRTGVYLRAYKASVPCNPFTKTSNKLC